MLFLASDHGGFKLKEVVKQFLDFLNMPYEDLGANTDENPDDYPDFAKKLVKKIKGKHDRGILFCTSGAGMCMAANRHKGIRAVSGGNEHEMMMARVDNDANVLCLGAKITNEYMAKRLTKAFLDINFSAETRHKRRIKKLDIR